MVQVSAVAETFLSFLSQMTQLKMSTLGANLVEGKAAGKDRQLSLFIPSLLHFKSVANK